MRKLLCAFFITISAYPLALSQSPVINGTPVAEIFTDFHINLTDTSKHTGFDINRAFLGYQFLPESKFYATLIVNIGIPEDLAPGSKPRRYAFFREASLAWSNEKLTMTLGITGTRIFDFQQRFWGKRYIATTFQSRNGYGFVADLGFVVDYRINDIYKADFTIMNGEGYSNIQLDDKMKVSAGLTITPTKEIAARIYSDIHRQNGMWQPVIVGFLGFKNDLVIIGGEISYKSNIDLIKGHHAWGISATGGININKNTQIFVRYDYSSSVIMPDDILKWNYLNDGSFVIAGVEHAFSSNVKLSLNYQGTYPYASAGHISDLIYVNALFKF